MLRSFLIIVFALMLIFPYASNKLPQKSNTVSHDVEFYFLALQWGNSFCNSQTGERRCFQIVPQEFIVHGLWCDLETERLIADSEDEISLSRHHLGDELYELLRRNWPNLIFERSNLDVWRHQWKKHGKCLGLRRPRDYFEKGLSLKSLIEGRLGRGVSNLVDFFINQGLPPRNDITYDPQIFTMRMYTRIGYVTQLNCNVNRAGQVQLYEVRFCFTRQWVLTHCPYTWDHDQQSAPHVPVSNSYGAQSILFPALPSPPPPPPRKNRRRPPPPPPPSTDKKSPPLPQPKKPSPPAPPAPPVSSFPPPLIPFQRLNYLQAALKASLYEHVSTKFTQLLLYLPVSMPLRPPFQPDSRSLSLTYLQAALASLYPCTPTSSASESPSIILCMRNYLKMASRTSKQFHGVISSTLSCALLRTWMRRLSRKKETLTKSRQNRGKSG